jgi:uncharacterized membrane protein YecN with MAPEG domain
MSIASLYASLLALLFVGLSIRTLRMRRGLRIAVGDGGNAAMLRAMRVHANFAEYVPLSLLLLYLVERSGANASQVHLLGLCLLVGRVSHAIGVSRVDERYAYRVFGMAMTFVCITIASVRLLWLYYRLPEPARALLYKLETGSSRC